MTRRTFRQIISDVSLAYDVPVDRMLSQSLTAPVCRARWAAMKIIRDEQHRSFAEIAGMVNRGDHTTAMNGIRQAEKLIANDPGFASAFERARAL